MTKPSRASMLTDRRFWIATAERSVFTGAQAILAQLVVFTATDITDSGLGVLPWSTMGSVAVFAVLVSVVTSVAKLGIGNEGPGIAECLPKKEDPEVGQNGEGAQEVPVK
jgi:hypothetical protein